MGKFNTSTIMSKYSETNESFNFCGIDVQCKLMHNFDYIKYVRNPSSNPPTIQVIRNEPEKEESVGRHKYIFTFYEIVAKTPPTIVINKDKWLKSEIDMKDLYLFDRYVLILLSEVCYMQ